MLFKSLLILGGFLFVFGGVMLIVTAVSRQWPKVRLALIGTVIGLLVLGGAFFAMPKVQEKAASEEQKTAAKVSDPFYNAMQKAQAALAKVRNSRTEETPGPPIPAKPVVAVPASTSAPAAPTAPAVTTPLTLAQRLAKNRVDFKNLEAEFASLNSKRQALPKNNSQAIASFNLEAKDYAGKLAEVRSQQAVLLELQRTGGK